MCLSVESAAITLPTGILRYQGDASNLRCLTDICGVGARHNTQRGFVFVSKVLGKHWPTVPSIMLELQHDLARKIPKQGREPALVIGMAETATGLGHGIFEAFIAQNPETPALFLQTTRYPLAGAELIEFKEEHSHATQQFLYLPEEPAWRALLPRITTAILVDDEATTGKTFVNLAAAIRAICPNLSAVHPVMLTDFTEATLRAKLVALARIQSVHPIALWRGHYAFEREASFIPTATLPAFAPVACRLPHISSFTARLGLTSPVSVPDSLVDACEQLLDRESILVVGTGECMHPAFLIALALENRGYRVRVQSTTRSPLMRAGAIESVTQVADPYGEGIPNFIYNLDMSRDARLIVVHETREHDAVRTLVTQLDAIEVNLATLRVTAPPLAEII